ncbi:MULTISPECIES: polyprenyl synthetase family protein [unclassified Streptomyces]|uniref:polyprenyl synthetase family protein n=1 Tax=unclassified Streptomyces TaxID=2593676 RepID=UPI0038195A38
MRTDSRMLAVPPVPPSRTPAAPESAALDASPPQGIDLTALRHDVDRALTVFLDTKARAAADRELPAEVTGILREFVLRGGKRLRPLLCVVGWYAAGGRGTPPAGVVQVAASLEMFHAFALIHDDVMDGALLRRGAPTVHRALAAHHAGRRDADRLGEHAAILLGDLAHAWSEELLHSAEFPPSRLAAVREVADAMRWEVMFGQYLDLVATGDPDNDEAQALRTARYKTAMYTFERPLHLGAALAGADPELRAALSAYALPLGEAFQLRDDLLSTFGDPRTTGKPCLDDLRDGKGTLLVSLAMRRADPAQRHTLNTYFGSPGLDERQAGQVRAVLEDTGARAAIEHLISTRHEQARHALDRAALPPAATDALREISFASTERTS